MMKKIITLLFLQASLTIAVELDLINCGVDHEIDVSTGNVTLAKYPWSGILYYLDYAKGDVRAVTTVVLIHKEFVLAAAADIGPLSKRHFRKSSRVLLGEDWEAPGRRVRNYVIHPEYGETYNTLALIQLTDIVRNPTIKPLCPPPERLRKPKFYVVKFDEDYKTLQKQVHKMEHIPGGWCKDFYVGANLYSERMRPPHVACALSLQMQHPCVWHAGAALVSRDVWGRWQLLGFGVRGPGCGVPSRYLDLMSYDPWIRSSLRKFQRITITKLNKQAFILRSASAAAQRFGACDAEETTNLIFRESIVLRTDNNQYQFLMYNMTLYNNIDYKCITLELINASAVSEMRINHYCTRYSHGPACYAYKGSVLDVSVYLMFSDKCIFEMFVWGDVQSMALLDIQKWKWEEGTYYKDFSMTRVEYRGQTYMTDFGFEPLDYKMWVPEYDVWTTTEFDNSTWSSTTPPPTKEESGPNQIAESYEYKPTTSTAPPTKKRYKTRSTTKRTRTTTTTTTTKPTTTTTTTTTKPTTTAPLDKNTTVEETTKTTV